MTGHRQAASRVRSFRPDVVVIDVASFGPRGYAVRESICSHSEAVPVVLLLESGRRTLGETAEAYMIPPFTARKLLYRIKKVSEHLSQRELRAGSLSLDPQARTLQNGDRRYNLRPKEAALLAVFMTNPGRVISRQELTTRVWEPDYMGDTRTLNVHVRWLRQKIEADPGSPRFLRTVRGVGYRFEVPVAE